jgi:NTE family protein
MVHIAERSFHLAIASEMNTKRHLFDLYIEPTEITNYSLFDLKKSRELFDVGYRKTVEILKDTAPLFRQEIPRSTNRKKKSGGVTGN